MWAILDNAHLHGILAMAESERTGRAMTTTPKRYRKKPKAFEAIQYDGENKTVIKNWVESVFHGAYRSESVSLGAYSAIIWQDPDYIRIIDCYSSVDVAVLSKGEYLVWDENKERFTVECDIDFNRKYEEV